MELFERKWFNWYLIRLEETSADVGLIDGWRHARARGVSFFDRERSYAHLSFSSISYHLSFDETSVVDFLLSSAQKTTMNRWPFSRPKYAKCRKVSTKSFEWPNSTNRKFVFSTKVLNRWDRWRGTRRASLPFKECPNGAVTERDFQSIYAHFFPHGSCQSYSRSLFRLLDRRKRMYFTFEVKRTITKKFCTVVLFEDYIQTLSILVRGSVREKLQWIFRFYDVDDNGKLTKQVWEIAFSPASSWRWSMTIASIRLSKPFCVRCTIYLERTIVFISQWRKRHSKSTSVWSSR